MDIDTKERPPAADEHPAAGEHLPDADHGAWTRNGSPNTPDRYGGELAATLEQAGECLTDPEGLSRAALPAPADKPAKLKRYRAGSTCLDVDAALGHAALDTMWAGAGAVERDTRIGLVKQVLEAIKPRNELEGLIAVQMIAAHSAAMEAYRKGALQSQSFAGYSESLNQAAKASRTFAVLLETLDRHRGKGSRQQVEVRHVHVHAGGQAVVGVVGRGRGGNKRKTGQPHDQQAAIAHASESALPCPNAGRHALPVAGDAERPMPQARRREPRRTDG